jgi:porin
MRSRWSIAGAAGAAAILFGSGSWPRTIPAWGADGRAGRPTGGGAAATSDAEPRADTGLSADAGDGGGGEGLAFSPDDHLTGDWAGARSDLAARGISFDLTVTSDITRNLRGGLSTNALAFQYLFLASVTAETEPLFGWRGGTISARFEAYDGTNPSLRDVGDYQFLSNIAAEELYQLGELWYAQDFFADGGEGGGRRVLRLKAGKLDVYGDFIYADAALEFLNSGMGYPVNDLDLPSYPLSATGFEVFIYPTPDERTSLGFGLFDGAAAEGFRVGGRGPGTFFGPPADLFLMAELRLAWDLPAAAGAAELPGRVSVGGSYETGDFATFDGGEQHGLSAAYLIVEQQVWRERPGDEDDAQGVAAFASYDYVDGDVYQGEHHASAGFAWTGPVPGRDADVVGLGASWISFTDVAGAGIVDGDEVAVEAFYKVQITPWFSLKPDLQYIANPGGIGVDDALAATLRVEIAF